MDAGPPLSVVPQYAKIAAELRDKIMNGSYGPGALLPSRNEIIDLYGVSAITARDALSLICQQGYAKAVRGRGHIVRRKRPRLTVPSQLYTTAGPDPEVALELFRLDIYRELPPDNIALPLEADADTPVWVRRAVYRAVDDRQAIQIHVSWIVGLDDAAENAIRGVDPAVLWPLVVGEITGRPITAVGQHVRARRANSFEAEAFGIPDGMIVVVAHLTTYDAQSRPVEHSRYTWPTDAVRVSGYYAWSDVS
jgi:GntR family transcriptional regulator